MNRLDELKKLYVIEKEYLIPLIPVEGVAQAIIKLSPLSLEDMSLLDIDTALPVSEQIPQITALIAKCLRMPVEEVKKISAEYLQDLTECVLKANNVNMKENEDDGNKVTKLLNKYKHNRGSNKPIKE